MINQERIKNLLLELVQIDSVSRKERDVAERIKQHCEEMGAQLSFAVGSVPAARLREVGPQASHPSLPGYGPE